MSSIASIAWAFSSNYSQRKFGQMSLASRGVYFLYNLLAVISRITCLEYFLISLGEQYFLCIYPIIGGHMAVVLFVDIWLNWKSSEKHWFWKGKSFIIRAFSSLYVHFPATEDGDKKEEDLR